jgi:hypothetical protein
MFNFLKGLLGKKNQEPARFVEKITANPDALIFRILNGNHDDPRDWDLEPLPGNVLAEAETDGFYILAAFHVLPDGSVTNCYMDCNLPERISDNAYFVRGNDLRHGCLHEFDGEIIPAVAIDCYGSYELFYSKISPEVGIDVLKRGLSAVQRKGAIAEDLGYIMRDEERYAEAAAMFEISAAEGASSYFIYGELAEAYAHLGNAEKNERYRALFKRGEQ